MNEVSLIQASIEQLERLSRSIASIGETEDYTEVAINALEKQMPKKPIFNHNLSDTLSVFRCECGNIIKVSHDAGIMDNNNAPNYCSRCGCRLDWSDEE
jgi:hypothetical protein